jgi:alpha-N-arabinofuranosidase
MHLTKFIIQSCCLLTLAASSYGQTITPVIQIQADKVVAEMPPTFYGLMTEEINYSYEGGLYGELIRNRAFKADAIQKPIKPENYDPAQFYSVKIAVTNAPKFWSTVGSAKISLDTNSVLNTALNVSLKLDVSGATKNSPAGIANGGYWGIALKPSTTYRASFYAKAKNFKGELTVSLVHVVDPKNVITTTPSRTAIFSGEMTMTVASATIPKISGDWKKYEVTLTTDGKITPSKDNRLVISTTKSGTFLNSHGTIWLQQVSLMPPTFKNRPNGNRSDISQLLDDAHPKFLRFPGGNYVEGDYFNERFNWKETIGPVEQRPGHRSCWGYWSTDGFGLPEFLGWCQDLKMEPVLAVFAGYTLKRDYIPAGEKLAPYVQEALEEIEYVTSDATTKWGAQRVKDGYPEPFKLRYVEIGNEDWFDRSGSYDGRFAQFYDAIKARYPQLKIISTVGYEHPESMRVHSRTPDLVDEHYYRSEEEMEAQSFVYDSRDRSNPTKIFVGEWATRVGSPTPNMAGALGDAAWMCCLERNADIVHMHCYAPLFVNVSDLGKGRSMQWQSDLIGYNALTSYGSPSYYGQKMFSEHQGNEVLTVSAQNLPTYTWIQKRTRNGQAEPPRTNEVKSIFYSATRDTRSDKIIVKIVNRADVAQDVKVEINGANTIADSGTATVLKADNRNKTNTIDDPTNVLPVTENVTGLSASFTRSYPPCSITILELSAK